jgi:hypothetical protein
MSSEAVYALAGASVAVQSQTREESSYAPSKTPRNLDLRVVRRHFWTRAINRLRCSDAGIGKRKYRGYGTTEITARKSYDSRIQYRPCER